MRQSNDTCQLPGCEGTLYQATTETGSLAGDTTEVGSGPVMCTNGHKQDYGIADDEPNWN